MIVEEPFGSSPSFAMLGYMMLIVGLGNPGKKFEKTRHNVGFMTIDNLQLTIDKFSDWKNIKKLQAEISKGEISGQKIILAKPLTFMNNSGQAVKSLNSKFKILNSKLWVVHDDIDLPFGKIRISKGRGAAGHKGMESIIREMGTKDFVRFRIGINPQRTENRKQRIEKFVLKNFKKDEEKVLKEVIEKAVGAIEATIKEGVEKAMNKYNQ